VEVDGNPLDAVLTRARPFWKFSASLYLGGITQFPLESLKPQVNPCFMRRRPFAKRSALFKCSPIERRMTIFLPAIARRIVLRRDYNHPGPMNESEFLSIANRIQIIVHTLRGGKYRAGQEKDRGPTD
jgi:hypothetical protein